MRSSLRCANERVPPAAAFMYRYDVAADGDRTLWIGPVREAGAAIVAGHALARLTTQ